MQIGWLWFALALAWIINLLLFVWLLRLRMEVWANRRVIASLETVVNPSAQKGHSKQTNGVSLVLLLVVLGEVLLLVQEVWR